MRRRYRWECNHRRGWNGRKLSVISQADEDELAKKTGKNRQRGSRMKGTDSWEDRKAWALQHGWIVCHASQEEEMRLLLPLKRERRLGTRIPVSVHDGLVNHDCPYFSWLRVPVIYGEDPYCYTRVYLHTQNAHGCALQNGLFITVIRPIR